MVIWYWFFLNLGLSFPSKRRLVKTQHPFSIKERSSERPNAASDDLLIVGFPIKHNLLLLVDQLRGAQTSFPVAEDICFLVSIQNFL